MSKDKPEFVIGGVVLAQEQESLRKALEPHLKGMFVEGVVLRFDGNRTKDGKRTFETTDFPFSEDKKAWLGTVLGSVGTGVWVVTLTHSFHVVGPNTLSR